MGISKKLAPGDLPLAFGAIAFPLHVWAIVNILVVLPAWLLRMSLGELAGGIGYPLVDALLESALLWLVFVLFSLLLPKKWLAEKFVALSSALAWLLAAWAMGVQFTFDKLLRWGPLEFIPGLLLVAASFVCVYWIIQRSPRLQNWIKSAAQALAVPTYLYVACDLLGLVVVILRNL